MYQTIFRFIFMLLFSFFYGCGSSSESVQGTSSANDNNAIEMKEMTLHATFHHVGIQVNYRGDENKNASVKLEANIDNQGFKEVHRLSRAKSNRFVGTIFSLKAESKVVVRMTTIDSEGVRNGTQTKSITTRTQSVPLSKGKVIHVSIEGDNRLGTGSEPKPYATLSFAFEEAKADDTLLVHAGIYYESINPQNTQGTKGKPITVRSAGDGEVVLDGASQRLKNANEWKELENNIYTAKVEKTRYVSVDGVRLWRYENLLGLKTLNKKTKGGFFLDDGTLYVRLANDASPQEHEIQVSVLDYAFRMEDTSYVVFDGLIFRNYGVEDESAGFFFAESSNNNWIVNCYFKNMTTGIWIEGLVDDLVVMNNDFSDFGVNEFNWHEVKEQNKIERGAIFVENGEYEGQGIIFYKNVVHDIFDGIKICGNSVIPHANNADIEENIFRNISDDGIEADGVCSNVRVVNNSFENMLVAVSVAPAETGPVYIIRNSIHNLNNYAPGSEWETTAVKFNVGDEPQSGEIFIYHNTATTKEEKQAVFYATNPADWQNVVLRNNIWSGTEYSLWYAIDENLSFSEDYDLLYSKADTLFLYQDDDYYSIPEYNAVSGRCEHCIEGKPLFMDVDKHNYNLSSNSPAIDKGVLIKGINDDFQGDAPDIGVLESKFK